jgi:hypothetical protein
MAEDGPHLYGAPDGKDIESPAPEGLRGEEAPTGDRPDLTRRTVLGDGQSVTLEETSGVAFAEANGAGQKPRESPS